ncbi:MAG: GWxTD domain-containing protein [Chitinophagales bacterium]
MKHLSLFFLLNLIGQLLNALNPIVEEAIFYLPNGKSYIETYILIPSSDVVFVKNETAKLQAKVEITMLFKQNEQIVKFDKYTLTSKAVLDSSSINFNLLDIKRNSLEYGNYDLEISFSDLNNTKNIASINKSIKVSQLPDNQSFISDIVFLESYKKATTETESIKNGFLLVPNIATYYPQQFDRLAFYVEIYNMSKNIGENTDFLLRYSVVKKNTSKVIENVSKFKKQTTQNINILLAELDISNITSGSYELLIEVRNSKNELLTEKRSEFYRNKQKTIKETVNLEKFDINETFVQDLSKTELIFYVEATVVICSNNEKSYIRNLVKDQDYNNMARFLYYFWDETSTTTARQGFIDYRKMVDRVEQKYATPLFRGFESDRGRVTLQYGLPNDFLERHKEPDALPYEVWHYYKLNDRQRNVKFVFYDDTGVGTDFKLIHSNALNELNNERWREVVFYANSRYIDLENEEQDIQGRPRNRDIIDDF